MYKLLSTVRMQEVSAGSGKHSDLLSGSVKDETF